MLNPCLISPFLFLIPGGCAFYYGYTLYGVFLVNLVGTSVWYHSTFSLPASIVDKAAISSIVLYGGTLFVNKLLTCTTSWYLSSMIVSTFIATLYLYMYGRLKRQFCFAPSAHESNRAHASLHGISAVGHLLIILL